MQEPEPEAVETGTTRLSRILSEIRTKGDLPAGAEIIQQIQTAIRKEDCNALDVVRIILKDTALSSKVLRVVNSTFYRRIGNPVSTVTGAIVLLGFQTIRDLTTGLLLIDHFTHKGGGNHIREGLRRSLYCGLLSQALSGQVGYSAPEEAYLLGLIANFAHLWLAAYYPDDFDEAVRLQEEEKIPFERALARVLGGPAEAIAAAALAHWDFPSRYLDYFSNPPATDQQGIATPNAKLAALVNISADYIARTAEQGSEGGRQVIRRFQGLFSLKPEVFFEAARAANTEFCEHASCNGLAGSPVADNCLLEEMLSDEEDADKMVETVRTDNYLDDSDLPGGQHQEDHQVATPAEAEATTAVTPLHATTATEARLTATQAPTEQASTRQGNTNGAPAPARGSGAASPSTPEIDAPSDIVEPEPSVPPSLDQEAATAVGIIADITRSILGRNSITETLSMVLEGVGRVGRFDVAFLSLMTVNRDRIVGRLGYGDGVREHLGSLSVSVRENEGMIADTVLRRSPITAADTSAAVLVPQGAPVPPIPGRSFISHPLILRGKVLGALVAARTAPAPPTQDDLAVLRLFSDQACLALERSVN